MFLGEVASAPPPSILMGSQPRHRAGTRVVTAISQRRSFYAVCQTRRARPARPSAHGPERRLRRPGDDLHQNVLSTIATFKKKDPGIQKFFDGAVGYAVFPTIGKGAIGIGGGARRTAS